MIKSSSLLGSSPASAANAEIKVNVVLGDHCQDLFLRFTKVIQNRSNCSGFKMINTLKQSTQL